MHKSMHNKANDKLDWWRHLLSFSTSKMNMLPSITLSLCLPCLTLLLQFERENFGHEAFSVCLVKESILWDFLLLPLIQRTISTSDHFTQWNVLWFQKVSDQPAVCLTPNQTQSCFFKGQKMWKSSRCMMTLKVH